MRNKTQVLLCGTGYGQTYLPAIYQSSKLELAAILSRGSEQSKRLAEQAGVNLYTEISAIKEPVDIACVAIGDEAGKEVTKYLLRQKVAVLAEHPMNQEDFEELNQISQKENTPLHVNAHFSSLEPANRFIEGCSALNEREKPLMIQLHANSRTLYSMIDLLMQCFGLIEVDEIVQRVLSNNYVNCTFSLNGIPCNLNYQRWKGKVDNSMDMPLGHQLTIIYPSGTLTLNGTYGPCIWSPLVAGGIPKSHEVHLLPSSLKRVTPDQIINWRIQSNLEALHELLNARDESFPFQSAEHLLHLTNLWTQFYDQLGIPQEMDVPDVLSSYYLGFPKREKY